MFKLVKFALIAAAACCAAPVLAADEPKVSCAVAVDYVLNGTVAEPYRKDFLVKPSLAFSDDFSTPIRTKTFTASVAREAGNLVVSIDYFNDVGVFNSVGFNTRLTIHRGRGIESTSGSHTFSMSQGIPAGNHATNYTLTCKVL